MKKLPQKTVSALQNYLKYLEIVEQAIAQKNGTNKNLLQFWSGLVRDADGRWLKYYFEGYKYFQYGMQHKPNLRDMNDVTYIKTSIQQQKEFAKSLLSRETYPFDDWLISLHKKQIYSNRDISKSTTQRFALVIHSRIVLDAVIPLARRYKDPYQNIGIQTVQLAGISQSGLPIDIWESDDEVHHYYPDPQYFTQYLAEMEQLLEQILTNLDENVLSLIAFYYQYAINMHMFENINQSLFANQVNALLYMCGFQPISHGILDFVAMRFQPETFKNYFIDEVKRNYIPTIDDKYLKLALKT